MAKTTKATNSFFKGLYFICVTTWGYQLLKDEKYLPPMLLGKGNLRNINADFPNYGVDYHFKLYYLGTMGYHLYSLVKHCSL